MFDNPNEELKKLEQKLLEAEEPEDDFESFYQDILMEFGTPGQTASGRKDGPAKKAGQKKSAAGSSQKSTGKPSVKKKKPRKTSLKGPIIILFLESAGVMGIILWWLLRML